MPGSPVFLSKTKYLTGLQCPKLLWYMYNRKAQIPPAPPELEEVFKQGRIVGEYAQRLFPEGIKLEREFNPVSMDARSFEALSRRKPLFEAGFIHHQAYAIADILVPADNGAWDLIEVKSSTGIKSEHIDDASFQKYVYSGRGIDIRKCFLMFLNKEYIRKGALEPARLFKKQDVSAEVAEHLPSIEPNVLAMLKMIAGPEPDIKVGAQCGENCPLFGLCLEFLPEDNIFMLRSGRKIALALLEQGILKLRDIPEHVELSDKQRIQVKAHNSGEAFIDKKSIAAFLNGLSYPLYYLDFETMAPAIPVYDLTHPYEDIPFQYSLHVQKEKGSLPEHFEHIAPGTIDPRPEILRQLREHLGNSGSIVAYNAIYEIKCLASSAKAYPEYQNWFEGIKGRFADLLAPFKDFSYYHPGQAGSASLKKVLPAMTGNGYENLEISGGRRASAEYLRVTFEKGISAQEREKVRNALLKYCKLDTRGMVEIFQKLAELV